MTETLPRPIATRLRSVLIRFVQAPRIWFYRALSSGRITNNGATFRQPVLITGRGRVTLGKCHLGFWPSQHFFSGYIHIDAREATAEIVIEDGAHINNNAAIVAERSSIRIGRNTLIGPEVAIYDSDFHDIDPESRASGRHKTAAVDIGTNVFIGSRCTILKGTTIGNDSTIGAGCVVSGEFPPRSVIVGAQSKMLKTV